MHGPSSSHSPALAPTGSRMSRHCRCGAQSCTTLRLPAAAAAWCICNAAAAVITHNRVVAAFCESFGLLQLLNAYTLLLLFQARLLIAPPQQQQAAEGAEQLDEGQEGVQPKKKKGPKQPVR